jgi:hypothetical protein
VRAAAFPRKRPGCNSRLEKIELFLHARPRWRDVSYQIGSTNEYYQNLASNGAVPCIQSVMSKSHTDARRN